MADTLGIGSAMSDSVADTLGFNFLAYMEDSTASASPLRFHIEQRLASFNTDQGSLSLIPRAPGAILDVGGPNVSSSTWMMALPAHDNTDALAYASEVGRRAVDPNRTALAFVSRRFVDLPNDDSGVSLAIGYAEAVYVCQMNDGGADFIRLARGGARARRIRDRSAGGTTPPWMSRIVAALPPRDTLPRATPAHVVGITTGGRYGASALNFVGTDREVRDRSFAGIDGVVLRNAQLANPAASVTLRPEVATRPSDRPSLMASRQGLDSDDPPGLDVIYVPRQPEIPQTPGVANLTYGDPRWDCAGRTNSDSCHDCCDAKQSTAVGVGMGLGTAVGAGAIVLGAETGALAGIWAGPVGAAIGGLVGCLIGLGAALLATSNCDPGCDQLFPTRNYGQRQYRLMAVLRDQDGETLGYRGVDSEGSEWVLSRNEAVAALAGGMQIWVEDAVGAVPVRTRTRLGVPYLAAARDRRVTDNIGELPIEQGLPDISERGIALS